MKKLTILISWANNASVNMLKYIMVSTTHQETESLHI
jgi:hypothetical protein